MTILLHGQVLLTEAFAGTAELSSRPERSVVEGPAVPLPVLTQTLEGHGCLIPEVLRRAGTTSVFEARVFEDLSLLAGAIRRKRVQR